MTSRKLLRSDVSGKEIGTLIPDAILFQHGEVRGIVDAKYKSVYLLAIAPQGPQREDLYQTAAYLERNALNTSISALGVLAYPHDPSTPTVSFAESHSPLNLADGKKVLFVDLAPRTRRGDWKVTGDISMTGRQ